MQKVEGSSPFSRSEKSPPNRSEKLEMRLLGITHRWYHEPSLMFWIGNDLDRAPSLTADLPYPPNTPVVDSR